MSHKHAVKLFKCPFLQFKVRCFCGWQLQVSTEFQQDRETTAGRQMFPIFWNNADLQISNTQNRNTRKKVIDFKLSAWCVQGTEAMNLSINQCVIEIKLRSVELNDQTVTVTISSCVWLNIQFALLMCSKTWELSLKGEAWVHRKYSTHTVTRWLWVTGSNPVSHTGVGTMETVGRTLLLSPLSREKPCAERPARAAVGVTHLGFTQRG